MIILVVFRVGETRTEIRESQRPKDLFCSRNLKEYYEVKEIQFGEEELSGGKWALTDRWTLGTGQAETKRGSVRI